MNVLLAFKVLWCCCRLLLLLPLPTLCQDGLDPYVEVEVVDPTNPDVSAAAVANDDDLEGGLERAAAFGHAPIAAGKQPKEEHDKPSSPKFGAVPPPYAQLQGIFKLLSANDKSF